MPREYQKYFPLTGQPITILSRFETDWKSISFDFDTWISSESFNNDEESVSRLKKRFDLRGNEFNQFFTQYNEVFESIKSAALSIAEVGTGYTLKYLFLDTAKAVMVIEVERLVSKDDTIRRVKTAPEYHDIIAANFELIGQVIVLAISHAASKDVWIGSMAQSNENLQKLLSK